MSIDKDYFNARNVTFSTTGYIPQYLLPYLATMHPESQFLDIGCGGGQFLFGLQAMGYKNLYGIDIEPHAVAWCNNHGLCVKSVNILDYKTEKKFDFIAMNHVLEHIEKNKIIDILAYIQKELLAPDGYLYITVPNAQSNTGCYWAYEDFTHTTLFTGGSLLYICSVAGIKNIEILDIDGLAHLPFLKKILKKIFINIYKLNIDFWNYITLSYYHKPSPKIYTYEIKIIAQKKR